jgi:hypothetical protein
MPVSNVILPTGRASLVAFLFIFAGDVRPAYAAAQFTRRVSDPQIIADQL